MKIHIKVGDGLPLLYYVKKEDTEKLELILRQYNIKVKLARSHTNQLIFWEEENANIEKQWKLARKKERQSKMYYGKKKV